MLRLTVVLTAMATTKLLRCQQPLSLFQAQDSQHNTTHIPTPGSAVTDLVMECPVASDERRADCESLVDEILTGFTPLEDYSLSTVLDRMQVLCNKPRFRRLNRPQANDQDGNGASQTIPTIKEEFPVDTVSSSQQDKSEIYIKSEEEERQPVDYAIQAKETSNNVVLSVDSPPRIENGPGDSPSCHSSQTASVNAKKRGPESTCGDDSVESPQKTCKSESHDDKDPSKAC